MYRNSYQRGLLTIFYSCGSKPLQLWDSFIRDGYITRFMDPDIKSTVLEIGGSNVSTTYIVCPKGNLVLGIHMPFLVMIVKNLKKYFSFEVVVLDETGTRRRFRVSNFQSTTQILPLCTVMPIGLSDGWNQIQFNLAEFMRRAYQKQFVEVQKVKINANIRLRRVYFADHLVPDDQLPPEYKLYFPLPTKSAKDRKKVIENKNNTVPSTSTLAPDIIAPNASKAAITNGKDAKLKTHSKVLGSQAKVSDIAIEVTSEKRRSSLRTDSKHASKTKVVEIVPEASMAIRRETIVRTGSKSLISQPEILEVRREVSDTEEQRDKQIIMDSKSLKSPTKSIDVIYSTGNIEPVSTTGAYKSVNDVSLTGTSIVRDGSNLEANKIEPEIRESSNLKANKTETEIRDSSNLKANKTDAENAEEDLKENDPSQSNKRLNEPSVEKTSSVDVTPIKTMSVTT